MKGHRAVHLSLPQMIVIAAAALVWMAVLELTSVTRAAGTAPGADGGIALSRPRGPGPTATPACAGPPAWQQGPSSPPVRGFLARTVATDGKFYAIGGGTFQGPVPDVARFNPATNSWEPVAPLPAALGRISAGAYGGKLYIAGGYIGGGTITSTLRIYDIASNSWSVGTPLPAALEGEAQAVFNGKLYVIGGDDVNTSVRTTYIYDIATDTWSSGALLPDTAGRTGSRATVYGGLIYVYGGFTMPSNITIDTMLSYDPVANSWATLASANTGGLGNWGDVAPYLLPGKLLVLDGGDINFNSSPTTHIYDIVSNTYLQGPPMLLSRMGMGLGLLIDGREIVYGGRSSTGPPFTDTSELLVPGPCATPTTGPPTAIATSTSTSTLTPATATTTSTSVPATATSTSVPVPTSTIAACPITFADVPPASAFYPYVRCLACRSVLGGYSDGTFRPNNNITRGQIAKVVSNAANFQDDVTGRQTYTDVPPSNTFWLWIERLSVHGVMGGYQCGRAGEPCDPQNRPYFRPGNNATRAQITKIVSNAAGFNDDPVDQLFTDVPPSHTFYTWVQRLASRGVIGGYQCGGAGEPCDPQNRPYFRPGNNVTRGQASKIVSNTFFPNCSTP